MVLVLFYFTNRDMTAIKDLSETPDVEIQVIGKQWSWDFNYLTDDVYESGQHEANVGDLRSADEIEGAPGTAFSLPTLYLPVGESVRFTLDSRDVIHSFWVPAFLYKMDMIPERTNEFQITPSVRVSTPGSAPSSAASTTPACSSTWLWSPVRSTTPR
ncbi:hypothetical protein NKG05_26470 [Oerskovia sp. M15]